MPFINLIHEQREAMRRDARRARALWYAVAGSVVLSIGVYTIVWLQGEAFEAERAMLQSKVDRIKPALEAIEASEQQFSILSPRLTTLEDAAMATQRWARVLDHLSRSVPESAWLTQLRCSQSASTDPVVIELVGASPSQEIVSELILRIQQSKDLENVNLKFTQGDQVNSRPVIRFEVSANLKGTAAPQPKSEDNKEESGS